VVLGALVYRSVWCGAVGCVSGLRDAAVLPLSIRKSTFIRKVSLVNQMVMSLTIPLALVDITHEG
jgi:hypothetical protein